MKNLAKLMGVFIIIILSSNCEDLLTEDDADATATTANQQAADTLVDDANTTLFNDLKEIVNDMDDFGIRDCEEEQQVGMCADETIDSINNIVNLDNSYNKYEQALELDPDNKGANFGAGLIGITKISNDELLETTLIFIIHNCCILRLSTFRRFLK